jgi:uncharacterized membrane protein YphA (DoxX/SURF4 family)
MFYRVDYAAAVLLAGFLAGLLFSRKAEAIPRARLARGYYGLVASLLVLRTALFACTMLASQQALWSKAGGVTGDLVSLLFGALFGLALRRKDGREFLLHPDILATLCMTLAFTFATAGLGKAFSMTPMTEFFTQSGYSIPFLKFIIIAEVFGGIGLLLPWAFLPALLGLTIDMFGAVLTHLHNGDPLNDSTGAIGMLIRLAAVGVLWMMRPREEGTSRDLRSSLVRVGAIGGVCLLIAVGGGVAMRHATPSPSALVAPTSR